MGKAEVVTRELMLAGLEIRNTGAGVTTSPYLQQEQRLPSVGVTVPFPVSHTPAATVPRLASATGAWPAPGHQELSCLRDPWTPDLALRRHPKNPTSGHIF